MKRELIQNIKVIPYKSGGAIDRERFLSGVLAVSLGAATGEPTGITVKIAVTECDTQAGGYTAVKDKHVFIDHTADGEGAITLTADKSGNELHNLDLDLAGCKKFIKITVTVNCAGVSTPKCDATCAIALGDNAVQPVLGGLIMSRVYKQQPGPTDNKDETPAKETKRTRTTKPVEKDEPKEDSNDGE